MIKAYIDFWKRAFDFRGRSTRPDYWWAYLVNVIIIYYSYCFFVFLFLFFSNVDLSDPALLNNPTELQKIIITYAWPLMLFSLIELIPQLSLQIRRLRDAGFHPAWVLLSYIGLVPILAIFSLIGSIVLLIMSCQPTKPAPETQFDKVE